MTSPSASPPSEGEIFESDSEKATTAIELNKGTRVDRTFRTRVSVSRSPSPVQSPRRQKSRTASRSPFREIRTPKRTINDDHYDRARNDPRRFKVRYEDHPSRDRSKVFQEYGSVDLPLALDKGSRHRNRDGNQRKKEERGRIRSRSPSQYKSKHQGYESRRARDHRGREARDYRREQGGRGHNESRKMLSREQSVSDRGNSPVAAARVRQEAEFQTNQTHSADDSTGPQSLPTAKFVSRSVIKLWLISLLVVMS